MFEYPMSRVSRTVVAPYKGTAVCHGPPEDRRIQPVGLKKYDVKGSRVTWLKPSKKILKRSSRSR